MNPRHPALDCTLAGVSFCASDYARALIASMALFLTAELAGGAEERQSNDAAPPTAQEVRELMERGPLSHAAWPDWRNYYVRLFFAYDVDEPKAFYEQVCEFLGQMASRHEGKLPDEFEQDAVAWVALTHHYLQKSQTEPAVECARRARQLDRYSPISSLNLAQALLYQTRIDWKGGQLNSEDLRRVSEAEKLVASVQKRVPWARLDYWRGMVALLRGNTSDALRLLLQGTRDFPKQSGPAIEYLLGAITSNDRAEPAATISRPFVEQFPDDARVLAVHALALFIDEQGREACETLEQARRGDAHVDNFLGKQTAELIENGRWMTPQIFEAMRLQRKGALAEAAVAFRGALQQDAQNVHLARMLSAALLADLAKPTPKSPSLRQSLAESAALCERFPDDPVLHVHRAALLFRGGRSLEAESALDRAAALGADVKQLAGTEGVSAVRAAARRQARTEMWKHAALGVLVVYAAWIGLMFLLGFLLSGARRPTRHASAGGESGDQQGRLKWPYLAVLGLGLVMFYVSIPFVAIGLLAVTAGLFLIMLVVRIIHFGVLYRGLFATWGVIESAFVSSNGEVFGVALNEDRHPSLFATLREVALALNTRAVDQVWLTPLPPIGVREQGKGPFGLVRRRRVMEIGMPTFSCLTVAEFKSVMAHELAHFSHNDPAYARFVFQVSVGLQSSLAMMSAAAGAVTWINPFHWFYWLYLRGYLLLAAGFSRSREFLADERAALAYGKATFISALTKVAINDALFAQSALQILGAHLACGRQMVNVFSTYRDYARQETVTALHDQILQSLVATKPCRMDSHPTFSQRVAALDGIQEPRMPNDDRPATELLIDTDQLEKELTALLTRAMVDGVD